MAPARAAVVDAEVDEAMTGFVPAGAATGAPTRSSSPRLQPMSSSGSGSSGRFIPGSVLAGRYRIVGLLGKGGMGEVYRAEDLLLAQEVALKFLPSDLSRDADRLARFRDEVRTAREVSHPNVCRVYDIGEVGGDHFLSMEYIDGEDLASLLRRIGRLPQDKGVEIARQLCAGLAAAHDRGVLHRDLKPANVMIDGRGQVRLADFGLAGAATPDGPADFAGTPAYMAPEQFQGKAASVKTDIYALGLVLYEIFTGKAVVTGKTVGELARQHREDRPSSMTTLVGELDPVIERVIGRCLEKDPSDRPASALAVSAALPGGDPLQAAIARGETPSPELVAAAGDIGFVKPLWAVGLVALVVVGLVTISLLYASFQVTRVVPLRYSPDVLRDRARQAAATLGYTTPSPYSASGFDHTDYLTYLIEKKSYPIDRLQKGQPPALVFWYRESPKPLQTYDFNSGGRVSYDRPAPVEPGMMTVVLDSDGHLRRFSVVPPKVAEGTQPAPPDAAPLFKLMGFDPAKFSPSTPRRTPPVFADARAAWKGAFPDAPDTPITIEVASLQGRVVSVDVVQPWDTPGALTEPPQPFREVFIPIVFFALGGGAVLLAIRNARVGRGDRRGAFRVGIALVCVMSVKTLIGADLAPTAVAVMMMVFFALSRGILVAALFWVGYLALEPYVRRLWPHTLISWSRLLAGRWQDPLVARDVLAGVALGVMAQALFAVNTRLSMTPTSTEVDAFMGLRFALATFLSRTTEAVMMGTGILLGLFFLTLVVRRRWIAVVLVLAFFGLNSVQGSAGGPIQVAVAAGIIGVLLFGLLRLGLLTLCVSIFATNVTGSFPLTFDASQWYSGLSYSVMAVVLGVALLAFWRATPVRSLVARLLSE